jgi:hypothetical protein
MIETHRQAYKDEAFELLMDAISWVTIPGDGMPALITEVPKPVQRVEVQESLVH